MGDQIKKSNFEYGSKHLGSMTPFTTVSHVVYNHKGDANKLKAQLDDDKKVDLRTNHFTIGGGSANIVESV